MTNIALFSPGAMGASVGNAAVSNGHKVLWHNQNRSQNTIARAERAGLTPIKHLQKIFEEADVTLSICPPTFANEVAEATLNHHFKGIFVEANAISPHRTRSICQQLLENQITCVDGGIIGTPVWDQTSETQLYLSGQHSQDVASLFKGTALNAIVLNEKVGSASALKMTFAAYTKGSTALLAAILAVADQEGVREALQSQWGEDFSRQTIDRVTGNAARAWRFSGEMREIAETFSAAGLPAGFHEAAADIFGRLIDYKDVTSAPELPDMLQKLTSPR